MKLTVSNIKKSFNGVTALDNCSFSFEQRGIYVLLGPNGSGKSTFLRICALLEEPDLGEVTYYYDNTLWSPLVEGTTTFHTPSENETSLLNPPLEKGEYKGGILKKDIHLRRRVTLVLPKVGVLNTTVFNNVGYGLKIRGLKNKQIKERVDEALNFVGLGDKDNQNALTLSSGETQRLGIARAIVIEPEILFLDEPTASLDPHSTKMIEEMIARLKNEKRIMIVMVTHNIFQAQRLADIILFMYNGRIVDHGLNREFFEKPKDERAYKFITGQMVY